MYESGFHDFLSGHEAPLWQAVVLTFVMEVHIQKKKCAWLGGGGGFGQVKGVVVQRRRARDFRVHQDWGLKNLWAQPQRVDIYAKTVPNRANVHTLLVPGLVVVYGSFGAEAFWSFSLPFI